MSKDTKKRPPAPPKLFSKDWVWNEDYRQWECFVGEIVAEHTVYNSHHLIELLDAGETLFRVRERYAAKAVDSLERLVRGRVDSLNRFIGR